MKSTPAQDADLFRQSSSMSHERQQSSALTVGVAASGFASTSAATQAVQGFTDAINDGTLQSQMLSLASLTVSSVTYTQQPTITTSAAVFSAVPAPDTSAKKGFPGTLAATITCARMAYHQHNKLLDSHCKLRCCCSKAGLFCLSVYNVHILVTMQFCSTG